MRPPLDPELLDTFLAVVQHGRIAAAARAIHLSQPATTARVQRLERQLGTALLQRSVRGVEPTQAGLRLAEKAREVRRVLDAALDELAQDEDALGDLTLAASTTVAAYVLPPVLARFRSQHPGAGIEVEVGNTREVLDAVRAGKHALGIVEGSARAAGLRLVPWLDDELVPVMAVDAPFVVRRDADLLTVPILWREAGSGTRVVVAAELARHKLRVRPLRSDPVLGTSTAIAQAAAAGLGVAFLSRWSLGTQLASGRLRTIAGLSFSIRRTFRWALPAGALSGVAARFHRLATRHPPAAS